jgi:RHH-type proline utilization regulon transcriptional repressor/proline dehydrogenase/delta 1-pyrroline-5-carboxylate dehydrogenase
MARVAQMRSAINGFYRLDEEQTVNQLLLTLKFSDAEDRVIAARAAIWIEQIRSQPAERTLLEDFMQRYSLSTREGVSLMAIAECFLRVPDSDMADKVIIDKITSADWESVSVEGEKLLTSFSGWGLSLSESVLKQSDGVWGRMVQRLGLPVIRLGIAQAIKLLGGQFVCGRTIEEAIKNAKPWKEKNNVFSYDMLGEGARTVETAERYFKAYQKAIDAVGKSRGAQDLYSGDGISVKLSALHPRYEEFQKDRCMPVLVERLKSLALQAAQYNMMLTVDAEEADRLEISLDIFEAVWRDPELKDYAGLGLAVQAYQKRAVAVIEYFIALATETGRRLPIRLVKGAYWDTEVKRAQERGLSGYPVFTRKASTDLSYLTAADKMLKAHQVIYPAFATHNAFTISAILELAHKHNCTSFEFQRLHGMGQQLYEAANKTESHMPLCRIYAPVGPHHDLLPYLVRRLLENGANSSFVHQIYDKNLPIEAMTRSPANIVSNFETKAHAKIPLPLNIYPDRLNSIAPDLSDREERTELMKNIGEFMKTEKFAPMKSEDIDRMMQQANKAFPSWNALGAARRADIIDRVADIFTTRRDELLGLIVQEGKKTMPDAIAEWREAIDFCRYYAQQVRTDFAEPVTLPGPTGESNRLSLEGRGVFACISPWNFPLAIFTGQVVAALVTGNTVLAKPAEQTPNIAAAAIKMMHEAGVPKDALQLVIGPGRVVGNAMVAHSLTMGVVFTGSTETAWTMQGTLAEKRGPIIPFIAETGGQNAMIVDSTALAEQVVDDLIRSSFLSAGQRCSALRVLFLQEEISPTVLSMLSGAMRELTLGNPAATVDRCRPRDRFPGPGRLVAACGCLGCASCCPSAVCI